MSTSNNKADSEPCGKDCVPSWLGFVSYYTYYTISYIQRNFRAVIRTYKS